MDPLYEVASTCIIVRMGYRVAVAGASGYAGGELLRLLAAHPDLDVTAATAHDNAGQPLGAVHPQLRTLAHLVLADTVPQAVAGADLVFLALPHGASGSFAPQLPPGVKIVDLGADHRLTDAGAYERYYGGAHPGAWTYGLPELPEQRTKIADSTRVANTGCYAVAIALAVAPLIAAGVVERDDLVAVAASGTSGPAAPSRRTCSPARSWVTSRRTRSARTSTFPRSCNAPARPPCRSRPCWRRRREASSPASPRARLGSVTLDEVRDVLVAAYGAGGVRARAAARRAATYGGGRRLEIAPICRRQPT